MTPLARPAVELPKGVNVFTHRDESSPVASIALVVAVGARDDRRMNMKRTQQVQTSSAVWAERTRNRALESARDVLSIFARPGRTRSLGEVTLAGGNVVSWYELEPGVIATRESSSYPNSPMLRDVDMNGTAFTALELFTSLAPEEPVPEKLIAAYDRSRTLVYDDDTSAIEIDQVASDAETPITAADGVARVQQALVDDSACPWTWFAPRCDLCATGPCGDWQVSWPQITGDSSFSRKGTLTRAAMCVYRGAVRHVFRLRGKDIHDAIQRDGQWATFYLNNGSKKFTLGSRVEQAAGDGYHHCGQGH